MKLATYPVLVCLAPHMMGKVGEAEKYYAGMTREPYHHTGWFIYRIVKGNFEFITFTGFPNYPELIAVTQEQFDKWSSWSLVAIPITATL